MSSKGPKYYVVWAGHDTGVFDSWEECKLQVEGFNGARYKASPPESKPWPHIAATRRNTWDCCAP